MTLSSVLLYIISFPRVTAITAEPFAARHESIPRLPLLGFARWAFGALDIDASLAAMISRRLFISPFIRTQLLRRAAWRAPGTTHRDELPWAFSPAATAGVLCHRADAVLSLMAWRCDAYRRLPRSRRAYVYKYRRRAVIIARLPNRFYGSNMTLRAAAVITGILAR